MRVRLNEALRIPVQIRAPPPQGSVTLGNALESQRVLGDRVRNGLRVGQEGLLVEVFDGVTSRVVVRVEGNARLAAEESSFLFRLEFLGAGEETAGGDAVLEEGGVVGAAAEDGGNVVELLAVEEVFEVLLDGVGPGRAREVEAAAVTVVDAQDVVW